MINLRNFLLFITSAFFVLPGTSADLEEKKLDEVSEKRIYSVSCQSAGGFYGDIRISEELDSEKVKVVAAQGYAYQLSQDLGLDEFSNLSIEFDRSNCLFSSSEEKLIRCVSKQQLIAFQPIHPSNSEQEIEAVLAVVELKQVKTVEKVYHPVSVYLAHKLDGEILRAEQSLEFGGRGLGGLGSCQ